jgi:hypothetical protein
MLLRKYGGTAFRESIKEPIRESPAMRKYERLDRVRSGEGRRRRGTEHVIVQHARSGGVAGEDLGASPFGGLPSSSAYRRRLRHHS